MAVVILSFTNPEGAVLDLRMLGKTAAGMLKNPIILGIPYRHGLVTAGLEAAPNQGKTVSSLVDGLRPGPDGQGCVL